VEEKYEVSCTDKNHEKRQIFSLKKNPQNENIFVNMGEFGE